MPYPAHRVFPGVPSITHPQTLLPYCLLEGSILALPVPCSSHSAEELELVWQQQEAHILQWGSRIKQAENALKPCNLVMADKLVLH